MTACDEGKSLIQIVAVKEILQTVVVVNVNEESPGLLYGSA